MEFEENNEVEEHDDECVEIYSKKAVFWFSFLLGPIFGSVLLMLNLKEAGYKKAVSIVLLFAIVFDCLSLTSLYLYVKYAGIDLLAVQKNIMGRKFGDPVMLDGKTIFLPFLDLGLGLVGAFIISQYFFRKYFPDDDYYPKSISNVLPLFILVWIILQFIGLGGI
jgi:hypothetical protein